MSLLSDWRANVELGPGKEGDIGRGLLETDLLRIAKRAELNATAIEEIQTKPAVVVPQPIASWISVLPRGTTDPDLRGAFAFGVPCSEVTMPGAAGAYYWTPSTATYGTNKHKDRTTSTTWDHVNTDVSPENTTVTATITSDLVIPPGFTGFDTEAIVVRAGISADNSADAGDYAQITLSVYDPISGATLASSTATAASSGGVVNTGYTQLKLTSAQLGKDWRPGYWLGILVTLYLDETTPAMDTSTLIFYMGLSRVNWR